MQEKKAVNVVNVIIEYIEENIQSQISLEDISNYTNISKHHLHRLFKALTDKQLMHYVKSRKLMHSINDLLNTKLRIIDIANEYNFEYEQTYIRSFTRLFGLSPDEFRKKRCQLNIIDKINPNRFKLIGNDGFFIEPEIMLKPSFLISGVKHYINYEENLKNSIATELAYDFFLNDSHKIDTKFPGIYIGIVDHIVNEPVNKYYTASVEVANMENIPAGLSGRVVPTHKYAVFKYIGLHNLQKITANSLLSVFRIMNDWICSSNYFLADSYHFERIDLNIIQDDYCEVEIFIPVKDKQLDNSQMAEHTALYNTFFTSFL